MLRLVAFLRLRGVFVGVNMAFQRKMLRIVYAHIGCKATVASRAATAEDAWGGYDRDSRKESHAPPHPPRIADPSRGAREDRELSDRRREGGPDGRGDERHRRRRYAAESASEKGEEGAGCRRARVPVSRVRQLSRRMAPAPRAQDVDRLAHFPD